MPQASVIRYDSFTGGLNLRADPFQLSDDESPDMLNMDIDPRGGFAMRRGTVKINTSAIGGLAEGAFEPQMTFSWVSATPQLLVAANDKVFYSTGGNFTDTTITTTAAHGASMTAWDRLLYIATGSGSVVSKWNGSADTALTASATGQWQDSFASPTGTHAPKADYIAAHGSHMWVASTDENGTARPNRVRWSHPNFPESWREADFIDIVDGGDGITALVPFAGALLVFKRRSVHAIYGQDASNFQVVTLTNELGVPTPKCIASTESRVYFFSWPHGLYSWDNDSFRDEFDSLRPLIEQQTIHEDAIDQIFVSLVNHRIWVSVPEQADATPTFTYVLDPSLGGSREQSGGAWTRYALADNIGAACGVDYVTAGGLRYPIMFHPTNPWAYKVDQDLFQDEGVDYESYYVTKWVDAGTISAKKMWKRPDMVVLQPNIETILTFKVFRNWEESITRRTFTVTLPAGASGLIWAPSVGGGDHWATEDGEVIVTDDGTELLISGVDVEDGILGWGETTWGASADGSVFARGSNLGLARSIQLRVSGPGGLPWGVNTISYKFVPRRIR